MSRPLAQPIQTIFRHRLIETGIAAWVAVCPQKLPAHSRGSSARGKSLPENAPLTAQQLKSSDCSALPALGSFEMQEYPKRLDCNSEGGKKGGWVYTEREPASPKWEFRSKASCARGWGCCAESYWRNRPLSGSTRKSRWSLETTP